MDDGNVVVENSSSMIDEVEENTEVDAALLPLVVDVIDEVGGICGRFVDEVGNEVGNDVGNDVAKDVGGDGDVEKGAVNKEGLGVNGFDVIAVVVTDGVLGFKRNEEEEEAVVDKDKDEATLPDVDEVEALENVDAD